MKFNYSLIKKLTPGKYDKKILVEKLNLHSFETADLGGDVLEISVAPNRYSDASSHLGIARETAVIFGRELKEPFKKIKPDYNKAGIISVNVKEKKLCPRYLATYVADVKIKSSPRWMKNVLTACGLRPINNVVDIMNYVMLEIGQPLHAFAADKVSGGIIVRKAQEGEKIETIDGGQFTLNKDTLVIADDNQALAIAGIKGGKSSEVTLKTKSILVEAANFDSVSIYKTSRRLNLQTDASLRFAHNLSPELAEIGMKRALDLLRELAGAKIYKTEDVYFKKQPKRVIKLNLKKLEKLIGIKFKEDEISKILKKLGFVSGGRNRWTVPPLRMDVNIFEDMAEELIRFKGLNTLPSLPPHIALGVAEETGEVILKDKIRKFLIGAGFTEVYNYSFLAKGEIGIAPIDIFGNKNAVMLANPISSQFVYLRDSLAPVLAKNLKDNLRFYEEVRIFEIGKIFGKPGSENSARSPAENKAAQAEFLLPGKPSENGPIKETLSLGVGIVGKNSILELKGLLDAMFGKLGIVDYFMPDLNMAAKILKPGEALRIETGDHRVIGYLGSAAAIGKAAILELNLDKLSTAITEEKEYEPPSKYPSALRDLSILISKSVRVGEILELIQQVSPKLVYDVDLIDFYEDEKFGEEKKSLTFRIVFQSDERTLTDEEVDKEMAAITQIIEEKFDAELR